MDNIELNILEAERKVQNITVKNHFDVFELITTMLNLHIHGFNLIGKLDDKNSDTDWVWLFLTVRSFHSMRCALELMKKAYYAQAISLIRMVTEAYFLCGNCENNKTISDAILHNKPTKLIFNYKILADDMRCPALYKNCYMHECDFTHTSSLSLGAMTTEINPTNRELSLVPTYNEILFLDCCELILRNGLLMASFLEKLLDDLSKEKVNAWRMKAKTGVQQIEQWLDGLKAKYGNR